jgi:Mrp family chromosome partitioning ATPase
MVHVQTVLPISLLSFLADVNRAINMFGKMEIKILGLVENMSYFKCSHAG